MVLSVLLPGEEKKDLDQTVKIGACGGSGFNMKASTPSLVNMLM